MVVGKSVKRVDAFDKVTGRARYTDDLVDKSALIVKICHSTIAHGMVKSIDKSEAEKIAGVVKILTCFDVPDRPFPTAGHPWSTDPHHQDVADRLLLNRHVRYYGDDIAVVIAEDEVTAEQGVRALKVEYEEFSFVLDPQEAMKDGAPLLHEKFKNNILAHTGYEVGNYEEAILEPGLVKIEGWYDTPTVQHCHIENHICYAEEQSGKIVIVSSTQIPHIVRRICGQALGLPWGSVRLIKPYIGGGFGNKQDALYEPLCGYCCQQVGGRLVKLDVSREETFVSNRVRHAIRYHIITFARPDGRFVARRMEAFSNQGAYASHGHGIVAKGASAFKQIYVDDKATKVDAYTIFTNTPASGAMRAYGIPQVSFAIESNVEDAAEILGIDSLKLRQMNMMPVGYKDDFTKNINYFDSLNQCIAKGKAYIDYERKHAEYAKQTGPIRRGVGMAIFWYNTAVWPISLEASSCRMVMNQDGSVQFEIAETEIGQGADTAFAQMVADTVGVPFEKVHVMSTQDTDITPFGTGAYASRQTYVAGFAIHQIGTQLKNKVLNYASYLTGKPADVLDLVDGIVIDKSTKEPLMPIDELATTALYSLDQAEQFSAEGTTQIKSNAYSFGCGFVEVEVDIPMCKVTLLKMINVHDCGRLINPQLAEAQVHGGMSMAIGYGMGEQLLFDPKTGKPLNNNLLDYKLCTMMDHPDLKAEFVENFEPTSPFGTKALGEPPTCPGAPAIRNAIFNATGVSINQTPMTPHVLFARFKEDGLL
ncbi:MAG: xanthine dehydrogenase molybdenum-binding subunit XdhA [Eubacteriales bacterium]|nr:xanthine dehydrogenase molybdenum-binding subunit XdhA [Eubacteriales bacterium]